MLLNWPSNLMFLLKDCHCPRLGVIHLMLGDCSLHNDDDEVTDDEVKVEGSSI